MRGASGTRIGPAGVRPVHQGEPPVQPAGRARRYQRDRAGQLYRPRSQRWRRAAARPGSRAKTNDRGKGRKHHGTADRGCGSLPACGRTGGVDRRQPAICSNRPPCVRSVTERWHAADATNASWRSPGRSPAPHEPTFSRDSQGWHAYFYQCCGVSTTMGAQLNIKSEDAYRLASRLSELTGESLTSVVTKALRAELEREERERDARGGGGSHSWLSPRKSAPTCANPSARTQAGCMTRTGCPK